MSDRDRSHPVGAGLDEAVALTRDRMTPSLTNKQGHIEAAIPWLEAMPISQYDIGASSSISGKPLKEAILTAGIP